MLAPADDVTGGGYDLSINHPATGGDATSTVDALASVYLFSLVQDCVDGGGAA